jgi:hypothetical protein
MIPLDRLSKLAADSAAERIQGWLKKARLRFQTARSVIAWDPGLMRHVYEHDTDVLLELGPIEIELDEAGEVAAFRDTKKMTAGTPSAAQNLSPSEALAIALTSTRVSPHAMVTAIHQGHPIAVVTVEQKDPWLPAKLSVEINVPMRQIAAFTVLEGPKR